MRRRKNSKKFIKEGTTGNITKKKSTMRRGKSQLEFLEEVNADNVTENESI
ncbi:hypothetical protein TELCIR_19545 [Teladorsagia circumcincta]|uniref:Uncharacterized protein n=1 Tax=Teladorsagia circumcincta TaxID=45464 RepID=A0A2G9TM47_TELCI|nr:hypothetical protein TELCIR_19545 [Teladorsagia circumcincta]